MRIRFHHLRNVLLVCCFLFILQSCGSSGPIVVSALVTGDVDGTYGLVDVTQDEAVLIDAQVAVNNTFLNFGLPVEFQTDSGLPVNFIVPIYYGDLTPLGPGDTAALVVLDWSGYYTIYEHDAVLIPGQVVLEAPAEGETIDANADVPMQWSNAGSQGYVASYGETTAFDGDEEESGDDDAGLFLEYKPTGNFTATVPASSTLAGGAAFVIDALGGDVFIFGQSEIVGSFFLVGTNDGVEATIANPAAAQVMTKEGERGSSGLAIVKEYSKKVEGMRFKVRESNPQQITLPGTIQLAFKMRRYKASVAFVKAYDIGGVEYFSWIKKRIYKSKNKKYYPSFSASPGTTVVFGTHDASYRGGTYSF